MKSDFQTTACFAATGNSLNEVFEDLFEKLERNDPIDVDAYLREHPEHAEQLEQLLPTMAALVNFGRADEAADDLGPEESSSRTGKPAGSPTTPRAIGDFRIIRELGRGGMGVIYEAEQLSIGRRVALKVLPFAAILDPKALQRFHNEVRAVGTLDHPHIVHIYSVGEERSVYFYAMQLIRGQSLAQVIEALRNEDRGSRKDNRSHLAPPDETSEPSHLPGAPERPETPKASSHQPASVPSILDPNSSPLASDTVAAALSTLRETKRRDFYRAIAELGIQAAEALDYAHQMGIVHRDIKPSNLMVECSHVARSHLAPRDGTFPPSSLQSPSSPSILDPRSSSLRLYVTDFGLARLPTDAGMTMTGDLIGTLRYMSPEQARGEKLLDQRSDIYSLGVTLYELVARRPAFPENDRQLLIQHVIDQEPTTTRHSPPSRSTMLPSARAQIPKPLLQSSAMARALRRSPSTTRRSMAPPWPASITSRPAGR